ncbi:hypothetical protein [Vibrio tetraodonis]|uniref:hypothetical protein n=1 Tax=Vibrio tetraodonis TaxID=2231647 RepID=UPI001926CD5C|nr:hypothetical protein [Vibrio tetraodonis]
MYQPSIKALPEQPFDVFLHKGGYWLTRLDSKPETYSQLMFKSWLEAQIESQNFK